MVNLSEFDKKLERMIKTPKEIKLIKKSAKISDSCIKIIRQTLKEDNITEKQLARRINKNIRLQKATLAFPTIVTCGKRSRYIHAKPTKKKIRGIGYADFGARYKGYRTDVTVPFVKGEIDKLEEKIVHTTLQAYKLAINSIKLGEHCWKLHDKIDKFLRKRGFKMIHSLGHGIGRDVYELPMITKPKREKGKKLSWEKKKRWKQIKKIKFQSGMVFTIEPGVYVKGIGGCRIENDVLMTKQGPKILTHPRLIKVGE